MQVLGAALALLLSTAQQFSPAPAQTVPTRTAPAHFAPVYVYDGSAVPAGARVMTVPFEWGQSTSVVVVATGLLPGRAYGAHVHQRACGLRPEDAGPHTQHRVDPVQPSVDPVYANPRNEVWLDFTTDRAGNAVSITTVPWRLSTRPAKSLVLHAEHTHTDPGHAGTAGARVACAGLREG
ncbi:hypothetical protein [Actinokineospora bangkokensis]|uniref:Superoxide dismutase n=1 Tax=Actinokineospora bangkokensis TaxID=1193682 RepID=A0A1Q9LQK8_9PSEU|nr:hypothetical protein [Actinokineospora bangkokensis]OLR94308.1 hypothetical protein BJP25_11075 [Actinokineospora bangkokensis]